MSNLVAKDKNEQDKMVKRYMLAAAIVGMAAGCDVAQTDFTVSREDKALLSQSTPNWGMNAAIGTRACIQALEANATQIAILPANGFVQTKKNTYEKTVREVHLGGVRERVGVTVKYEPAKSIGRESVCRVSVYDHADGPLRYEIPPEDKVIFDAAYREAKALGYAVTSSVVRGRTSEKLIKGGLQLGINARSRFQHSTRGINISFSRRDT